MKIIKLTEKQFDTLKSLFDEGNACRQNSFEDDLNYEWGGDGYIGKPRCTKEVLKKINNEIKIIKRIENKFKKTERNYDKQATK